MNTNAAGPTLEEVYDAIEKVHKLIALAANPGAAENEARVAEARVAAICKKYDLLREGLRVWYAGDPTRSAQVAQHAQQTKQPQPQRTQRPVFGLDGPPLSSDQAAALQTLLQALRRGDKVVSLAGLAGTGKTTLVRTIVASLWHELGMIAVFCAPTGKAAVRLRESVQRPASTIHRILYRHVTEDVNGDPIFLDPDAPCPANSLLCVDEASMIDVELAADIVDHLPYGASVLFIGDPRQLPPVNAPPGVDLRHPTAQLTTIHRQALDNEIIWAAHEVLTKRHPGSIRGTRGDYLVHRAPTVAELSAYNLDRVAEWFAALREEHPDPAYATLLTYTRQTCADLNTKIRTLRGFADIDPILAPGETVIVCSNNHDNDMMNGETFTISNARPYRDRFNPVPPGTYEVAIPSKGRFLVPTHLMDKPQGEFRRFLKDVPHAERGDWLHLSLGDCLTVHKAQGSQWDEVGLVWDAAATRLRSSRPEEGISWTYTAVTRAVKKLHLWKLDW